MAKQTKKPAIPQGRGQSPQYPVWLKPLQQLGTGQVSLLLFVLVIVVFLPSLRNGFINLDDPLYVYDNLHVQHGFSPDALRWAFTTFEGGFWHPVTWLSIMLDCQIWGLKPFGHHLTNVLFHATTTVLVFRLFQRMTGATGRSLIVALLFGLHPLHVESVVWAAERKDTLSALFFLLTMVAYANYAESCRLKVTGCGTAGVQTPTPKVQTRGKLQNPSSGSAQCPSVQRSVFSVQYRTCGGWYCAALIFFALGLMSKSMLVTVPIVLLLVDFWPLRRFHDSTTSVAGLLFEKLPFLSLSGLFSALTISAQKHAHATTSLAEYPILVRLANALSSCFEYLRQTAWPFSLAVFYPFPRSFSVPVVATLAVAAVLLCVLIFRSAPVRPYLAFGFAWYGITLLPVIGLVQVGSQAHADRYTYLPQIGVFVAIVWWAYDFSRQRAWSASVLPAMATGLVALCITATERQLWFWRDTERLMRHALAVTENNELAQGNLASALAESGRLEEAIEHWREAIRLQPDFPEAQYDLGAALYKEGNVEEARDHLETALALNLRTPISYQTYADCLMKLARPSEAIDQYAKALELAPEDSDTQVRLAHALVVLGNFGEALAHLEKALKSRPENAAAENELGLLKALQGSLPEAVAHFRAAVKADPRLPDAHCNLGIGLIQQNQFDQAIPELREALRLNPAYPEAHCNLGVALGRTGQFEEAISHLQEALRLRPGYADAENNLRIAQQRQKLGP